MDRKIVEAKIEFEKAGSTIKETIQIDNFESLAEVWFSNFKTWVSSQNTINRVRGYLDTYIIPQFGDYRPERIEASDIQLWLNQLAKKAKKQSNLEQNVPRKAVQKILVQWLTRLVIFSILALQTVG